MLANRKIYHTAVALLLMSVSGCIMPEVYEVKCSRDSDTGLWTIHQTDWNLGRVDDGTSEKDFDSLLVELTSTRTDSTVVRVMEHVFWEEGDSLCERAVLVSTILPELFKLSEDSLSIVQADIDSVGQIMATNGTIEVEHDGKSDDVVIRWPADTKEIYLKWRWAPEVEPFSKEERARIIEASRATAIK